MSCVWHIGDLHLGHRAITKYRDVSSVEENSVILVDNILSKVKKRDTLWLHGDIFFSAESVYRWAPILAGGVENIHLIMGNHDLEKVNGREKRECLKYLSSFLGYQIHGLAKNNKAWLSHAPIHQEELRGSINIHGHLHQGVIDHPSYVNVCADNTGLQPIKRQDILKGWRTNK